MQVSCLLLILSQIDIGGGKHTMPERQRRRKQVLLQLAFLLILLSIINLIVCFIYMEVIPTLHFPNITVIQVSHSTYNVSVIINRIIYIYSYDYLHTLITYIYSRLLKLIICHCTISIFLLSVLIYIEFCIVI